MNSIGRETFRSVFKALCVVSVSFMIAYWAYKFKIEDRDIGVVDFVMLDENRDAKLPLVSQCFKNPFLNNKIRRNISEINASKYLQYLKGEIFDEKFHQIDYENVSMKLEDYFLYGQVKLLNETNFRNYSSKFVHKEIFNGIDHYDGFFTKCFVGELHDTVDIRHVKAIKLYYNMSQMRTDLAAQTAISFTFNLHYPGKYLDEVKVAKNGWIAPKQNGFHVIIYDMELLRRRNSHNRKCLDDRGRYDEMVLERHVEKAGCRAPYQRPHKEYPICKSQKMIRNAIYKYMVASKIYPKPCERISKIDYNYQYRHYESFGNKTWIYYLSFPNGIKIISQSKEIDGHALMGNIGGYIGLFLGNIN